jgi:hypothetical protein
MTTKTLRYNLDTINDIIFQGFDYSLPDKTMKIISEIALQVGAPDYVRTPVFQKRENPMKSEQQQQVVQKENFKRKKGNKSMEIVNDEDWDVIRTSAQAFQSTKIEENVGINAQIDIIRTYLNKLTDKNYSDMLHKIIEVIDRLISENIQPEEMTRVSTIIFDIASNNRFYSKIYADLYSDLSSKYAFLLTMIEDNLSKFADLFSYIEYVDSNVNYDKFCENNKKNEKRKSLGAFYINLMANGIIPKRTIMTITRNLLAQVYEFISQDDKKNEVDELTENVAILYKKELYENDEGVEYSQIEGYTIGEVIEKIAKSKVKDYKSLTNKSLFKFMDMIDM